MKFGLSGSVIQKLHSVFAKHPEISKVVLYGSRAKGNYKTGSDIDLTLFGDEADDVLTSEILSKITEEIDDLLLPYTLDLSIFKQLSKTEFIDHIKRVGVVFYQKLDKDK